MRPPDADPPILHIQGRATRPIPSRDPGFRGRGLRGGAR